MTFRLFILIYGFAAVLLAGSSKKSKDLEGLAPADTVRVIVQYQNLSVLDMVNRVVAVGGKIINTFTAVTGVTVSIPAASLDVLAADTAVTYISLDRAVIGAMNYTVPTVGADIALGSGWDGKGTTVAIIDSGIADHTDLAGGDQGQSRVAYRESFVPGTLGNSTIDRYGHGTHVAGIVAGNGASSGQAGIGPLRGIAPKARLVDLQVLDQNGVGTDSAVIQALQRAMELKDVYGIRVVNLSLGRPVWALLHGVPGWRWPVEGDASPWYPSVRIFRQEHRDWTPAIDRIVRELARTPGRSAGG